MNFAQPLWLLGGVIACAVLLWRYRRFDRQQATLLTSFVSPKLAEQLTRSFSPQRRRLKRALFVAATACLFIALARPQAGFRWEETQRKGLEILFAVDTSKSMLAEDVKPNRLARAKLAVEDLLEKLNGDGVGLVAFAGSSFLQCPITLDYDAFRESLAALDTSVIPRGGTDIAAAIREAQAAFKTRASSDRILILLTDGEDLGGDGLAAARTAAKDGVQIFTVGVGSANGELVPVPTENGGTEFVKDESGQFVKSHLDEATLQQIAEATGGMYQPLGQQSQGLTMIYEEGLKPFTRHDLATRQRKVALEQFHWPLGATLLLLALEALIGTRRRARNANDQNRVAHTTQSWATRSASVSSTALILIFWALTPVISQASPGSAEKAYQKGDFTKAAQDYAASAQKQPAKPELQFNLGAAAYKSGEFAASEQAFQNALQTGKLPVQQSAYYNLGNTQYRTGQQTENTNPQETIKAWESAVQSYEAALQIQPDDDDAKHNLDLVKRKLEQLKQQQQQQQDQQHQNQDEQQQQNQSDQNQSDQDKKQDSEQEQNQDNQSDESKSDQGEQDSEPDQNQPAGNGSDEEKEQDEKNQSGSGQEDQEQPDADKQGQQNTASGNDQKPEDKQQEQQAGNDSQPESKKPSEGTPEANAQPDPQQGDEQAEASERREPGQMTKEEAKNLLDSLKGEERRVNAGQMARGAAPQDDNKPQRDW